MEVKIKTPASKLRPRQASYRISNDAYDMIQQEAIDTGWPKVICVEAAIRLAYGQEGEQYMRGRKQGSGVYTVPIKTNFSPEMIESLNKTAKERGLNLSELIREAARLVINPEAQWEAIISKTDENKQFGDIWGEIEKYLDGPDRGEIDNIMYGGDIAAETDEQTAVRHKRAKEWLLEKRMELLHY